MGARGASGWNEFSASDVIKMMKSSGERKKIEKTIIQLSNSFVEICGIFRERLTVCSAGCVFRSNSVESSNGKIKSFSRLTASDFSLFETSS